jgi:DNA-binding response OmpR family regulator
MNGLDKALRRAGHQVMIAKDLPTFTKALQDRAVDIVLVDNAHVVEAGGIAKEIAAKPTVLPVSKSAVNFLKTLDETMKSRLSLKPFSGGGGGRE